jgi:large subunit ribosomal protein L31e
MAAERTYTIPLRKEWLKSPKYRRAKKAVTAVKDFLIKHMKSEDIRLGKHLNEEIWKNGIKNPPGKVKINVLKDDKNVVRAELFGKKIDLGEKKEEKTSIAGKLKEKIVGKKVERPKKKKEEKAAEEEAKAEAPKEEKKAKPEEVKEEKVKPTETPKKEPKEQPKAEEKPAEKK